MPNCYVSHTVKCLSNKRRALADPVGDTAVALKGEETFMACKSHLVVSVSALCLMAAAAPALAQSSSPVSGDAGTAVAAIQSGKTAPNTKGGVANTVAEVVVTGQTSKGRQLLTASSDITLVSNKDIQDKAPRNLASLLEMVPGVFVENSAGNIDNNYEVRGLPGGSQYGVGWEEDGLAWRYHGDNDNYFAVDLNTDRAEAVRGGASTVLSVNAPGALFNIITKRPDFDQFQGMLRVGGASYGDERVDIYLTGPITDNLAYNFGGYVDENRGQRDNPYTYPTYHLKSSLEYKLPNGGRIDFTLKRGDQSDPYYADMPFEWDNGKIKAVPGMDSQYGNIGGTAFGALNVPSTYFDNPSGTREFSYRQGSRIITNSARIDVEEPLGNHVTFNSKTRYTDVSNDSNFLYPGSTGSGGLDTAVDYLSMPSGGAAGLDCAYGGYMPPFPIDSEKCAGLAHFPTTTQFGLQNLKTGVVTPASDVAALNALNGNGLLQQTTVYNNSDHSGDFGTNNYFTFDGDFGKIHDSLTVGAMYFSGNSRENGQSQGWAYLTDVRSNANIYNIVALNAQNQVLGAITNNGTTYYGWWGNGVSRDNYTSVNTYFNNELKIGDKLHIDFGLREEEYTDRGAAGNSSYGASPNQLAAGAASWMNYNNSTYWDAWDGTYSYGTTHFHRMPFTVGVNYEFTKNTAAYARLSQGYEDDIASKDRGPDALRFYEAGARYHDRVLNVSADVFEAIVKNQGFGLNSDEIPAADQATGSGFQGASQIEDFKTIGGELDVNYRPVRYFEIDAQGVFQRPEITNTVVVATYNVNNVITEKYLPGLNQYQGNVPERTPETIYTVKPTFYFSDKGEIFAIYHYNGRIYADPGNNLPLPGFGRTEFGLNYNITPRINFVATVDNAFNVLGLTEGNPRQGSTEHIVNGYFYGRSIPGRNANAYLTFKF